MSLRLRDFLISALFFETILIKIAMNANIEKTHIILNEVLPQRWHKMTFLFQISFFINIYWFVYVIDWLKQKNAAEHERTKTAIDLYKDDISLLDKKIWELESLQRDYVCPSYWKMQMYLNMKFNLRSHRTTLMLWRGCLTFLLSDYLI